MSRQLMRLALSAALLLGAGTAHAAPLTDFSLAQRFRPYLMFDSSERFRPIDVDAFLAERRHEVCEAAAGPCRQIASAASLAGPPRYGSASFIDVGGIFRLHLKKSKALDPRRYAGPDLSCNRPLLAALARRLGDCDRGPDSRIYFHVVHAGNTAYIEYWFFYRFDDTDLQSSFGHQSDWEGIVVAVSGSDPQTFDWAAFAAHKGAPWRYPRGALRCDSTRPGSCGSEAGPRYGRRVIAYVANGSHASYPAPCRRRFLIPCGQNEGFGGLVWRPERGFDGSRPWAANNDPAALASMDGPPWAKWPGHWNAPFNAQNVATPTLQGRFLKPEVTQTARCAQHWCRTVL